MKILNQLNETVNEIQLHFCKLHSFSCSNFSFVGLSEKGIIKFHSNKTQGQIWNTFLFQTINNWNTKHYLKSLVNITKKFQIHYSSLKIVVLP